MSLSQMLFWVLEFRKIWQLLLVLMRRSVAIVPMPVCSFDGFIIFCSYCGPIKQGMELSFPKMLLWTLGCLMVGGVTVRKQSWICQTIVVIEHLFQQN